MGPWSLICRPGRYRSSQVLKTILQTAYRGDIGLELYTYADTPVDAGRASLRYLPPLFQGAGFDLKGLWGQ
ncbi:MAG: hypothetical protein ABSF48_10555 [Thermodesulfobacteriota bacterium]|jgi:hypothetical protein